MYDVCCCQGHVNQRFALTLDSLNPKHDSFSQDFKKAFETINLVRTYR